MGDAVMAVILDGRAIAAASLAPPPDDLRVYLLACYPKAIIPPIDHVVGTAAPMMARVNHGVWIASCGCGAPTHDVRTGIPNAGCVVFLDTPLGWCVRCGNRAWGGGWRPIVVPPEDERRLIEAVLLCRPNVGDRNWEPYESVADLVAQNREHGDPVPDLDELPTVAVVDDPSPLRFPPAEAMRTVLDRVTPRRGLRRFLAGR